MQLLVIKLKESDAQPEYALLGKKQESDRFTPAHWKRVKSLTRGRKVLLLISETDIVLTSIDIPSKNKKQLMQAIPFALEDTLAGDIETLHFAVHQDDASNNSHVAVISRNILGSYIDELHKHGITIHFVLPNILTQSRDENSWSLIYQDSNESVNSGVNVITRLDDYSGFSCDEALLEIFLAEQLEKTTPEKIQSNTQQSNLPEVLRDIPFESIDAGVIHYKSVNSALPVSLLTNFVRQRQGSKLNLKAWRPAAVIASLLAASWIGIFSWQNNLLKQQSDELEQQIIQVFKSSFPKSRIQNAPDQMKIELKKLIANSAKTIDSPLPLIANIGPLLKEYKKMKLSEIRYQENELSLTMHSPNLTSLEKFKKGAAEKSKLNISIKSSTTTSNNVEATLIVKPLTGTENNS